VLVFEEVLETANANGCLAPLNSLPW